MIAMIPRETERQVRSHLCKRMAVRGFQHPGFSREHPGSRSIVGAGKQHRDREKKSGCYASKLWAERRKPIAPPKNHERRIKTVSGLEYRTSVRPRGKRLDIFWNATLPQQLHRRQVRREQTHVVGCFSLSSSILRTMDTVYPGDPAFHQVCKKSDLIPCSLGVRSFAWRVDRHGARRHRLDAFTLRHPSGSCKHFSAVEIHRDQLPAGIPMESLDVLDNRRSRLRLAVLPRHAGCPRLCRGVGKRTGSGSTTNAEAAASPAFSLQYA